MRLASDTCYTIPLRYSKWMYTQFLGIFLIGGKQMIIEESKYRLHKAIGTAITECMPEGSELVLDQACGGKQQIPLFTKSQKSRRTQICKVDVLIIKRDQISIIIEI
jgi:hypothetical protein